MAKKVSYLDNIKKEIADRSRAADRAAKANYEARYGVMGIKQPGAQERASKTAQTRRNATGQLVGAIVMGARYDEKGRRISGETAKKQTIKPISRAAKPAMPKTGPAAKVAKKALAKKK